jgi:glycine/serine hydroxymethyltransferase
MLQVAAWIDRALKAHEQPEQLAKIPGEVQELCQSYPLYAHRLK